MSGTDELYPIRWRTFIYEVNKYQGGFHKKIKEEIFARLENEITKIEVQQEPFNKEEWENCGEIIKLLEKELNLQ